jgi:hypothetical protein
LRWSAPTTTDPARDRPTTSPRSWPPRAAAAAPTSPGRGSRSAPAR